MREYRDFWKRAFDYRGVSNRREYWIPVGIHMGLTVLLVIYYVLVKTNGWGNSLPFWILLIFLLITVIPFIALTVRRLKDTGMSGFWAFLLLFVGAGTCIVLALCAAGSGYYPGMDEPVNLYGPPPFESIDPTREIPAPLYGPPPFESETVPETFDPSDNSNVDVYGPPEWFEPSRQQLETDDIKPLDPSKNIADPLYGPPAFSQRQEEK